MGAEAKVSTTFGDVTIPMEDDEWEAAVHELADDAGWDIGFVMYGLRDAPTEPLMVGVVVRVPGVADPLEAVQKAQEALGDQPWMEMRCDSLRCLVHPYDQFAADDE